MSEFAKKYKKIITDYPETIKDAGKMVFEVFLHLLALSLPLTFPVLYPLYVLWLKIKHEL